MSNVLRTVPVVLVALAVAGRAHGQSGTVTLKGTGVGADREAAVRDALHDAVLQAAATLVDSPTWVKERLKLKDRVVPKAVDSVKSHDVVKQEKTANGKVSVEVKVVVDKAALAGKLRDADIKVEGGAKGGADVGLGEKVVQFCKDRLGQTVGDGECGTLAQQALAAAGAAGLGRDHPGPGDYVWGELVFVLEMKDGKRVRDPKDGTAKPGDVVQYRDAMLPSTFKGRSALFLTPHHTAIVAEVKRNGDLVVFEQNVGGTREVVKSTQQISGLRQGWLRVYRPVPK